MAHRMACDHADAIAAIVSIAGATFLNPDDCAPSEPVSVLQVHGTNDAVIYLRRRHLHGSFTHIRVHYKPRDVVGLQLVHGRGRCDAIRP